MGEYCANETKEKEMKGYTWVHGNKIQYGGGNNDRKPSFLFNWTHTPYYMDYTEDYTRLFIKDRDSEKRCF